MTRRSQLLAVSTLLSIAFPLGATPYAGLGIFHSSDADSTEVMKSALDLDIDHADSEHYRGLSFEVARFRRFGQPTIEDRRVYFRAAGGDAWKWTGRVGSDGHTVLGSAAIHNESRRRQEYFIEREIIETPLGLQNGLYSTFLGAAFDVPFGDRTVLSTLVGAQEFGGENLRVHLRANLIHTIAPHHGLSAQLRVRYFDDSDANEVDYFAPGWYAQAVPTLQLRRHVDGWRYTVAAGYGRQRAADTAWRPARLVEASIVSPRFAQHWTFEAGYIYTNTPVNGGFTYDYRQFNVSLGRSF
jgi:hypothetical protein